MEEERKLILTMVAEGKITPQEADALLAALEEQEEENQNQAGESPTNAAEAADKGGAGPDAPGRRAGTDPGRREVIRCHRRQAWSDASGPVKIVNAKGDIAIDTWDEDAVEVDAELVIGGDLSDKARQALQETGVTLEERGGALYVRAFDATPYRAWGVRLAGADLRVRVPRLVGVDVSSVHGDVEAHGDFQEVRAEAVHGDLELSGARGRLKASSRNGDIAVHRFEGSNVEVDSTHGDVSLSASAAIVRINTVRGDVDLDLRSCREVRLETVSGDVEMKVQLEPGATCEVHTVRGDADVSLDVSGGLEVALDATSGDLECRLPLDQVQRSRRSLNGSRGDGATKVRLTSMHGDLTVR